MSSQHNLTLDIADWIVRQSNAPLPGKMDHHVRRMLLDHLAGVAASAVGDVSRAVGVHVSRSYTGSTSTAIGHGRTSALGAALLNGTNGHGIESDEGYTPGSMHPTSVVFPAVFAVAQERGISGERVLIASAIGMELACRIADAGHPATRNRHFHNTPIAGVFGAAAAVAVLLELDANGVANALGLAGSHASGVFEFLGGSAEVKRFHPGKAARDGIASADLAEAGLTGPTTIFEGRDGYFAAYAGDEGTDWFADTLTRGLGEDWVLLRTYVKPYPCCRHLHGAIDAVLALRNEHSLDAADISSIDVGTFAIATRHAGRVLDTILQAQLSLPFTVAVAAVRGAVTMTDFAETTRQDADIVALMDAVTVRLDEAAEASYPKTGRPAEVAITTKDGRRLVHRVEQPYGEPTNPMSDADLEVKARGLVEPLIGADGAKQLIESCWNFDTLTFLDDLDAAVRAYSTTT
ncbi:2-methylcitrate dehydratase [Rhodococcus sp. 06-418-5]|uniref:MmgE/PrpD family protein n=1 Tax=Rhodococcus sp. 06-418-5 TaxID=2022507 RepID=UPI000B9B8A89|nr:MmgE/PrpD family protein [Rhodococcus sp. 06-418-5]OZC85086.1 2-methylcitrate dehydratase [Rhodococcus sp. 06-418-5]OZC85155.1 2-methylcitrate dehydratase [Rhodococcus sp. 06-418-5]